MKKVGIITHYYKSTNYGGNLQAYALQKCIKNKYKLHVEQICYDLWNHAEQRKKTIKNYIDRKRLNGIFKKVFNYVKFKIKKIILIIFGKNKKEKLRKKSFKKFNSILIKNNRMRLVDCNIAECNKDYDIFITGSDQVWNLRWYRKPFFLDFVQEGKKKISYAASISMDYLTDEQKELFKNHLKDFKAISVREKQAISLLEGLTSVEPQLVVDPTLLLNREDWDNICSERIVKEKYIFCYALGDNKIMRKLLKKYAKKHKYKIVFIPFVSGNQSLYNISFGDIRLSYVTPQDFISLIKYAEYVFTDSFHGTVFSYIYQKQFFVFNRTKNGDMNSRIFNIVELFNCEERFIYKKEELNLEYLESLKPIEYSYNEKLEKLIESSKEFLRVNLEVEDE